MGFLFWFNFFILCAKITNLHSHFNFFRYVPAALETSRGFNGEKSAAVSGGGFSFHDMYDHAHNLHPNGNNEGVASRPHHHH